MTKVIHNIHDRTFNALMHHKGYVMALIKTHLPADLVNQVDWKTFEIKRMEGRHIRSDLTGEARADVLCGAKIGNEQGFFYLHAEHQSTCDPLIAVRILNYQTNFLLDYSKAHPKEEKLPLLISILYYHDKSTPFSISLDWLDAFARPELAKRYTAKPFLIDVSRRNDEAIKKAPPELAATEFIFKYIRVNDFTPHLRPVMELLKDAPSQIRHIALEYLLYAAQLEKDTFIDTIHQHLPFDEDYIMNVAKQYEETGFQHGKLAGVQEGIQKGILKEKKQTAKNMLMAGYDLKTAAAITQLPLDTIRSLQEELEGVTDI